MTNETKRTRAMKLLNHRAELRKENEKNRKKGREAREKHRTDEQKTAR
jgi:hypothetical protein